MSLAVLTDIVAGRAPAPLPFTVDQYHKMLDQGILDEGQPVELIDGVMLPKNRSAIGESPMSHGTRHAVTIVRIQRLLERLLAQRDCHVRTQLPVTLSETSEPEPDLALVAGREGRYLEHHPRPDESLLLIEVAESSLEYDRQTKSQLYAAADVSDYWIVNLVDDVIEAHQSPNATLRRYVQRSVHSRTEKITLSFRGEAPMVLHVSDLLPPR